MKKRDIIDDFVSQNDIAIVGTSRNSKKFGTYILKEMNNKAYNLFPVHKEAKELECIPCYSAISQLPAKVKSLIIVTPGVQTLKLVKEAKEKGIERIWIQQGAENTEALAFCEENNIPFVSKECIIMFLEPLGVLHKFHRSIWKLIGKYPK